MRQVLLFITLGFMLAACSDTQASNSTVEVEISVTATLTMQPTKMSTLTPTAAPTRTAIPASTPTQVPKPARTPEPTDTPIPSPIPPTPTQRSSPTPIPSQTTAPASTQCGLTLPLREGTPYRIGDRFDTTLDSRHHVGTDIQVESNGVEVVAPADGKIIWMGPDPNGGWGIDVMTPCGFAYGVFHIAPAPGLGVGVYVRRGQYLGTVDFPGTPHIHLDVKVFEGSNLYFVDIYPQSDGNCVRWKFNPNGNILVPGKCSPGYWLGGSPMYP